MGKASKEQHEEIVRRVYGQAFVDEERRMEQRRAFLKSEREAHEHHLAEQTEGFREIRQGIEDLQRELWACRKQQRLAGEAMTDGLKHMGEGAAIYRPTVILKPEMVEMGDHSRIDAFVKVEGGMGVRIGRHVHISSFSHINLGGGVLTMEDYSGVSSGVRVATAVSKFSAVMPESSKTTTYSFVHFKRWSIAYVGALILPGVTLHEGACAAAGAVIRHDIPPWEIWGGNPARKIGTRTPEGAWRYEEEHEPHD